MSPDRILTLPSLSPNEPRAPYVLVVAMAGLYSRFRAEGFTTPKWLLPYRRSTLLEQCLGAFTEYSRPAEVVVVANRRDGAFHAEILAAVSTLGARRVTMRWTEDTRGQAETAALGAEMTAFYGNPNGLLPLWICNIDTLCHGRDLGALSVLMSDAAGLIDTFPSNSPAFSYVRTGQDGEVTEIAEKVVISDSATSGLYGFASARSYLRAYGASVAAGKELYVSDVYREVLDSGARVLAVQARPEDGCETVVLGTPAEYAAAVGQEAAEAAKLAGSAA